MKHPRFNSLPLVPPVHDPGPEDPNEPDTEESVPDTLRVVTPEDAARAALVHALSGFGRQELHLLTLLADLLRLGAGVHGPPVPPDTPYDAAGARLDAEKGEVIR